MILLALIVISVALIILYVRYKLNYWKRRGVEQLDNTDFIFGNFKDAVLFQTAPGWHMGTLYRAANSKLPYVGFYIFHKPCLLLRDPEIIKQILVRDFENFSDRHFAGSMEKDSIGMRNLFGVKNPVWRYLRTKISPTLTKAKLKQMFPLMTEIGQPMMNYLEAMKVDKNDVAHVDVQELNYKYTTDLIASVALGTKINTFVNPNMEFSKADNVDTSLILEADSTSPKIESTTNDLVDKAIMLYLRHNMSLVCLEDCLKFWNEDRDECDKFPTEKKRIMKLFREHRDLLKIIYFVTCGICGERTKINAESTEKFMCCDKVLKKSEKNFFVYMPIVPQIRLSIENNWAYISEFDTSTENTDSYSDAHHGQILKDILNQYKDSDVNILSLLLNLDGANKFNSNSVSLWPIQLAQNYLPPTIRFKPNNIIVAGLYYSDVKLKCREYLLPLVNELFHTKENNIEIKIADKFYTFKPLITHCAVDLPAKSMIQETKQHGSYDGCTYCEIPGELVFIQNSKNGKKLNNRKKSVEEPKPNKFVRYVERNESYKLRDEADTLRKMLEASSSNVKEAVDGIKDVSCLVALEHFNILFSIGVDYMHCVLLGVEKRMTNFFMNPKYSGKPFYIAPRKRQLLNNRILAIKPPSYVVRKPRSLDQRSNFKASEHRFMLLYYLPVCLAGCVPDVYIKHLRLLSAAVYILLQEKISRTEVQDAENMLHKFVKQHQELFGKENMVMVVHLLQHLAGSVRKLGPLWCHSAFPFERYNGILMKMVSGTTDVLLQVSSKYTLSKSILKKNQNTNTVEKILLGKSVNVTEKTLRVLSIDSLTELNFSNVSLCVYKRIKMGKTIFTSLLYTRPKRSIDYFIGLQDETFGMAKFYLEYNSKIYVVMERFEISDYINHILKVQSTNENIMSPIDNIQIKYIYMKVGLHQYVVSEPNPYEYE